jgi:hypothetical protein
MRGEKISVPESSTRLSPPHPEQPPEPSVCIASVVLGDDFLILCNNGPLFLLNHICIATSKHVTGSFTDQSATLPLHDSSIDSSFSSPTCPLHPFISSPMARP